LRELPACELTLCDITPRQLLALDGESEGGKLSPGYRRRLAGYRYGPAAFKVDFALSRPIPWNAAECLRAATVHVGGSIAEIEASEAAMASGRTSERPFMLVAQPTLFDATRAPEGKHIAWAYCHVPNGSAEDMSERIVAQIERFATGFRDCTLARRVSSPADLEAMDANIVGGDIMGGAMNLRQLLFRPTWRQYGTSAPDVFVCSSSTPPGGGVHGMCGANAARMALRELSRMAVGDESV
jgi:phytoene dehydrogenase-like protein